MHESDIKKYVKLSGSARMLIDNLNNFDFGEFLDWWIKNKIVVADSHVLEYLNKKGDNNGNKNS